MEIVTPCERRVSRNVCPGTIPTWTGVTPCERRVSRNEIRFFLVDQLIRHALREACE